jgi:putative flippase GtrA
MSQETTTQLSIVLPAYNEAETLQATVAALQDWIDTQSAYTHDGTAIIIVEDGCTDRTPEISADIADIHDNVRHLHFDERQGKGRAIMHGFDAATGDILCFMDVDRATDLAALNDLVQPLETGNASVAIGSRYTAESDADRTPTRDTMSRVYNGWARVVLGTGITDHQCGFKAITRDAYKTIQDSIAADGWFWDTELLFTAQQNGFTVVEVPITWQEDDDSAVSVTPVATELLAGTVRLNGEQVLGDRYDTVEKYIIFAVIGGLGAVIHTGLLYMLTEHAGLHYMMSSVIGIEASIITMFFLNNRFTFSSVKSGTGQVLDGIIRSNLIRSIGIGVQLALLYALTEFLGIYYILSNIVAIFIGSFFNFFGEKWFNWQE